MRFFLISFLILILLTYQLSGQLDHGILQKELMEAGNDTLRKISVLNNFASSLRHTDAIECQRISREALRLALSVNYLEGQALACYNLGQVNQFLLGNLEAAYSNYLQAIQLFENLSDTEKILEVSLSLATMYLDMNKMGETLKILEDVSAWPQEYSDYLEAEIQMIWGTCYFKLNKLDKSLEAYTKAHRVYERNGFLSQPALLFFQTAKVYKRLGETSMALEYESRAIEHAIGKHELDLIAFFQIDAGKQNFTVGNWEASRQNLRNGLQNALKVNSLLQTQNAFFWISKLDSVEGDCLSALKNYQEYARYHDSIATSQNEGAIEQLEYSIELDKLGERIRLLTEQEAEREALLTRRKNQIILMGTGIFLFGALSFYLMYGFVKKKKQIRNLKGQILELSHELKNANKRAQDSDQLKDAFLANISHEIRTPVNAITGLSRILKDHEAFPGQLQEMADMLVKSSDNLLQIIDHITEITRIESNDIPVVHTQIALADYLSEVEEKIAVLKNKHSKQTLHVEIEPPGESGEKFINTDKRILHRITHIVLENAIQYTEAGEVILTCRELTDGFEFIIRDTGRGIEACHHDEIFEKFKKLEYGGRNSGAGLGLAIAKIYTEILGGKIWVESRTRFGSTFRFILPNNKMNNLSVSPNLTGNG